MENRNEPPKAKLPLFKVDKITVGFDSATEVKLGDKTHNDSRQDVKNFYDTFVSTMEHKFNVNSEDIKNIMPEAYDLINSQKKPTDHLLVFKTEMSADNKATNAHYTLITQNEDLEIALLKLFANSPNVSVRTIPLKDFHSINISTFIRNLCYLHMEEDSAQSKTSLPSSPKTGRSPTR